MFNFFKKKQSVPQSQQPVNEPGALLLITATTNFGIVVSPVNKEPLMYKMEPTDTVESCVERNASYISDAVDVSTCLVVELAAQLPNQQTRASNKIYALILPDPGILLNKDLVLVGYEELGRMPGPTSSMLQLLVKQVPQEYFADSAPSDGHVNMPNQPIASEQPQPTTTNPEPIESTGFDPAPITTAEQVSPVVVEPAATVSQIPSEPATQPVVQGLVTVEPAQEGLPTSAVNPENPVQTP